MNSCIDDKGEDVKNMVKKASRINGIYFRLFSIINFNSLRCLGLNTAKINVITTAIIKATKLPLAPLRNKIINVNIRMIRQKFYFYYLNVSK